MSGYSQNCLLVDATANNAQISIYDSIFSLGTLGISNNGSATPGVGNTLVVLNSGTGVSSPHFQGIQGTVELFDPLAADNSQRTSIADLSSHSPALDDAA